MLWLRSRALGWRFPCPQSIPVQPGSQASARGRDIIQGEEMTVVPSPAHQLSVIIPQALLSPA